MDGLLSRLADHADIEQMSIVMDRAIAELQKGFLTPDEIASSRAIMGLDRLLVDDRTYFVVESDGRIAGCGGWSRRATLYGSSATPGRDPALLNPDSDPARIRAMYTDPEFVRRGVGRLILRLCEDAARAEGFKMLELMATLSGAPLYRAFGFEPVENLTDSRGGAPVPLIKMRKAILPPQASNSASQ
ncbi:GNAT family N-acetyltransferase [Frigidibacter sp. RF13]|uniref:GNAT family N-acetyltransferase n=1 Tax=Frigidibacter sp. RF13 TaxID=2997340 RepID=UPI00226E5F85|nr:GNAT family N-acetyltransferase [Frigidibacter sp. RF13]MCY1125620.1 GNAT family N-acetyltransferase [Frigidibacter sp. RF13]